MTPPILLARRLADALYVVADERGRHVKAPSRDTQFMLSLAIGNVDDAARKLDAAIIAAVGADPHALALPEWPVWRGVRFDPARVALSLAPRLADAEPDEVTRYAEAWEKWAGEMAAQERAEAGA